MTWIATNIVEKDYYDSMEKRRIIEASEDGTGNS
jgi:hypothetical protein